jgi:hypothetical protein
MVEASGYIFQDVETLLKSAKEALEVAKTGPAEAQSILKESLTGTFQELDKICSRYKDDAEAAGIRNIWAGSSNRFITWWNGGGSQRRQDAISPSSRAGGPGRMSRSGNLRDLNLFRLFHLSHLSHPPYLSHLFQHGKE